VALTIVPVPLMRAIFVIGSRFSYDPPHLPSPVHRYDRVP